MSARRRRWASVPVLLGALMFLPACAPGNTSAEGSGGSPPSSANPSTGPMGPVAARGGPFLTDRFGRTVLFHGVNLVYKVPPYEVEVQGDGKGPNVLTRPEVQSMSSLGFDAVRLGIIWKELEPGTAPANDPSICTRGTPRVQIRGVPRGTGNSQFDAGVFDRYLSRLDSTVALLARYGIYSLLDMHQDVYSEAFAGEGAPDWAVCTDGLVPHPRRNVPDWSVNLNDAGVVQAYEHFWRNDVIGDLQGQFDDIWARVAAHYRHDPWVLGYDPLNEPYGQALPPSANGAAFDAELQCFYAGRAKPVIDQAGQHVTCPADDPSQGVISRIESADPTHLVFYEPNYTTDSSVPSHIGPMPFPRLVLNTHDYCFLHVPNGPEPPGFATTCGPLENAVFTQRATELSHDSTVQQPGGPAWMLTEFGATTDTADLARITSDADAHLIGWLYWQWLHYQDPTGSHTSGLWPPTKPTPAMLHVLSRPYARAIAGVPTVTSFDPSTGRFSLEYQPDPDISEPTVVSVPLATHYPHGYCANVTGGRVTSRPGSGYLDVETGSGSHEVSITITPGRC